MIDISTAVKHFYNIKKLYRKYTIANDNQYANNFEELKKIINLLAFLSDIIC